MYTILFIQPNQDFLFIFFFLWEAKSGFNPGSFASKIFLDKAYNKLEWPFIENFYLFIFIYTNFLLISLNSSWIVLQLLFCLFYGMEKIGSIFCPTFGLRQGDTLSPYNFLCLNHSSLCFDQALYTKKLKPLTIKCHHIVFNYFQCADDMFLQLTPNLSVESFLLYFPT